MKPPTNFKWSGKDGAQITASEYKKLQGNVAKLMLDMDELKKRVKDLEGESEEI